MKKSTAFIFMLLLTLFLTEEMYSQTEQQKAWLFDFSDKATAEWQKKRTEAESLAVVYNIPVLKQLSDGTIIELQRFENGLPVYDMTDNIFAAATISTRYVWPDGFGGLSLTGNGQILGLWEAGGTPLFSHQEYSGRVTQMDGGGSVSEHASHVAGTMIASGINTNAKGMSFQGNINSYTSGNDLGEISTAAANGLKVSSHSYGLIEGWTANYFGDGKWAWFGDPSISETEDYSFGFYSSTSSTWDNFLYNAPNILVCKSAGNDRGDGPGPNTEHWVFGSSGWVLSNVTRERDGGADGYDCVNDPRGIAKNTLTVGAINDIPNGYNAPSDVVMSSFSTWGPTDDGRIKPDIVANGVGLISASNTSSTSYSTLSGTSMSTPNVSGSVGLLLQQQLDLYGAGNPFRSSTMKALLIHSADEAGSAQGPDYIFGWGLMNTYKAVRLMKLDHEVGGNTIIKEMILTQGNFSEFQVQSNGTEPVRVTICWTDPAGTPAPISLNPPNIMLVHDLDLRVTDPSLTVHQPWVLNPSSPSSAATTGDNIRDNVEQVHIQSPIAGSYTIRINHKGTLAGGSQNFSVVISGGVVAVPETITLVEPLNATPDLFPTVLFKWERAARSMYYQLQVSNDSTFASTVFDQTVEGIYREVENLPALSTLYWRVRAVNSGGNGNWSVIRYFTTALSIPLAPVLLSPADGAAHQDFNLDFNWMPSASASTYRIQISNNAIFTSMVVNDSTLTSNTYSANQLAEGKKLYWRVNAKNSSGAGEYSTSRNFTTKLAKPDSLSGMLNLNSQVELNWIDRSSLETKYFIIRKISGGIFALIDSLGANQNSYTDTSVLSGNTYHYAVFCKNNIASSDTSNEVSVVIVNVENENDLSPTHYTIEQNFPNPFNPSTKINYGLPFSSNVRITIYNSIGEMVVELINSVQAAGFYSVQFDGSQLSSGIYFYRLDAMSIGSNDSFSKSAKMILLK